ncbi:MAG: NAD-dependent epimerase/dehydratase family protein [Pseudodonghicola sp.]
MIGGCGFIGSHVVDQLVAHGLQVRVYDRRPEPFRAPVAGVDYVMGDLADTTQLYEATNGVQAIIHLASTTVPSTSNLDPVADITGNLIATVRLLEMMRATDIRKLVYLSSGGTVYGVPETDPVAETHPLHPISSYGIVKVAIENYLYMEHKLHGLQHVILRASNPYGPRQGHTGIQGIIGTHLWRIARNEPIEVWGDGSVVRDFIHVRDLARLCVQAVLSEVTGCFNAGSGEGASVNQIVQTIDRTVQATGGAPIAPIYKPGRSFDVPRVVLDITRARADIGWTPEIGLEAGIAESWDWVRSRV